MITKSEKLYNKSAHQFFTGNGTMILQTKFYVYTSLVNDLNILYSKTLYNITLHSIIIRYSIHTTSICKLLLYYHGIKNYFHKLQANVDQCGGTLRSVRIACSIVPPDWGNQQSQIFHEHTVNIPQKYSSILKQTSQQTILTLFNGEGESTTTLPGFLL